jgi:hypothetical protein
MPFIKDAMTGQMTFVSTRLPKHPKDITAEANGERDVVPESVTMLRRYWNHPAKWWQFWWPQSGFLGGLFWGTLILTALTVVPMPRKM